MNCAPAIIGKPNGLQKIKDKYFEEMLRISNLKRDEKYPTVFLFGPLCIASVLSFIHIGKESLWIDEAFSVKIAQLNWSELWEIVSKYEANGSLYLILLKYYL